MIANCCLFIRRSCLPRGGSESVDVEVAGVALAEGASVGLLLSGVAYGRGLLTPDGFGLTRGNVAEGDADGVIAAVADGEGNGVVVSSGFGWRRNGVAVADVSGVWVVRAGWNGVAVAIGAAVAVAVAAGA